jgi:hypothetical protein
MYFPCFSSAGSYLQCIFLVSAQREAICNVFSVFQLSGKLSAMFFPCFSSVGSYLQCIFPVSAQREAFLQCIFLVLTQRKAIYNVFPLVSILREVYSYIFLMIDLCFYNTAINFFPFLPNYSDIRGQERRVKDSRIVNLIITQER